MSRREDLIEEIIQMRQQWEAEAPSGRKVWPKSIRNRALELMRGGLTAAAVAKTTGIAYFTVLNWKKRSPEFRALAIAHTATVTVANQEQRAATVTVTTTRGLKIEGLVFDQVMVLLERLK